MSHKCRSSSGECAPPQGSKPVRLDAMAKEGGSASALRLKGCLDRVDGSEDHSKASSAKVSPGLASGICGDKKTRPVPDGCKNRLDWRGQVLEVRI